MPDHSLRRLAVVLLALGVGLSGGLGCVHHAVVPSELQALGPAARRPRCRVQHTIARLSHAPEERLDGFDRAVGALTTPLKKNGIQGWTDTGCNAVGVGVPVRAAQRSSDGQWTVDVALQRFQIGGSLAPSARFLRLELGKDTAAARIAEATPIGKETRLAFGGLVLVDMDGPFLEVHPAADFHVESAGQTAAPSAGKH